MKKRVIALFLVMACILSFGACADPGSTTTQPNGSTVGGSGGNTPNSSNPNNTSSGDQAPPVEEKPKFNGDISRCGPFSEGAAIVTDGATTWCIDLEGNILFQLDQLYDVNLAGQYERGFQNGLVKIGEYLYDKQGNVTKPEDVGVTRFYDYALAGGYVVAYKETVTYNSSVMEIGILNTEFEWVVPLSEQLYKDCPDLARNLMTYGAVDGYIIDSGYGGFVFEVATSKIYRKEDKKPEAMGEYGWVSYTDGSMRNGDEIIFQIEGASFKGEWKNGLHLAVFTNVAAKKYFFTLVNTKGEFVFEPVEAPFNYNGSRIWDFNGTHILVQEDYSDAKVAIYDITGNKLAESSDLGSTIVLGESAIIAYNHTASLGSGSRFDIKIYDMNLNLLFS